MLREKSIHRLFEISIVTKGMFAVLDILGGLLLLIMGTNPLVQLITVLAQGELVEDSNDLLANYFLAFSQHYSPGRPIFIIVYLLTHGLINTTLVVGLWRNWNWAYPFTLSTLSLFMVYQLYRITLHFSPWLMVLTVFDLIVIWLVWHEYQRRKPRGGISV